METSKPRAMDVAGICKIIASCKEAGVRSFEYRELKLSFEAKPAPIPQQVEEVPPAPEDKVAEEKRLLNNELMAREEELSELRLRDPFLYEQAIQEGDLEEQK